MKFSKSTKFFGALFMSFMMTPIPSVGWAQQTMISTSAVAEKLNRQQAEQDIQDYLSREEVRKALIERGVAPEEVSSRLASLSETELRQLSGQVEMARAGGDILVTILIVVLIIFLIKRI